MSRVRDISGVCRCGHSWEHHIFRRPHPCHQCEGCDEYEPTAVEVTEDNEPPEEVQRLAEVLVKIRDRLLGSE